jgi:hypothetical protein
MAVDHERLRMDDQLAIAARVDKRADRISGFRL